MTWAVFILTYLLVSQAGLEIEAFLSISQKVKKITWQYIYTGEAVI